MREIKFRAWDTKEKRMFYKGSNIDLLNLSTLCNGGLRKLIWMQYTEVQDKNGKEIYEGDILFNPADKFTYVIQWNRENCCFELGEEGFPLRKYQLPKFWEIIGNIYRNPGLLTEEKCEPSGTS